MKGNYILTLVLTLLVGISIGIFGLSTYQNLTNTNNNNQEEKENNNQRNQLTNISYKEVKQLVDQVTDCYQEMYLMHLYLAKMQAKNLCLLKK